MSDYTEHARLSPSGSKKWFACPGSITLEAPIPNKSSTYADDGTAMHEIAARCLTQHYRAVKWIGEQIPVHAAGEEPRFVEFDDEMADLTQGYVDTVRAMAIGYTLLVEQRVDFSEFVGVPGQFGTLDCRHPLRTTRARLFAVDLKTGRTPVHVERNSQLLLYLLGLLRKLLDDDLGAAETDPFEYARRIGIKTCRIGIYQPKLHGRHARVDVHARRVAGLRRRGPPQGQPGRGRRDDVHEDAARPVGPHVPQPEPQRGGVRVLPGDGDVPGCWRRRSSARCGAGFTAIAEIEALARRIVRATFTDD